MNYLKLKNLIENFQKETGWTLEHALEHIGGFSRDELLDVISEGGDWADAAIASAWIWNNLKSEKEEVKAALLDLGYSNIEDTVSHSGKDLILFGDGFGIVPELIHKDYKGRMRILSAISDAEYGDL